MRSIKFYVSWIVSSISMFGLSYAWHAIVLNDFARVSYPKDVFLIVAAFVYLGIGLLITIAAYLLKKHFDSYKYGILGGAAIGVFIYAIAFLFGVSFNSIIDFKMIAFDLTWQTFEQAFGGLICAWTFRLMTLRERRLSF
ncbi:MAG: hypothetical protein NWS53_09035 [Salibacteraceae bacterium]|nr:hypothetical protein [Salibacteraceae bacterium]